MKRIFFLAMILSLMTTVAFAQRVRPNRSELTRTEVNHLRTDQRHYIDARRKARRDGIITPAEQRRLKIVRRHERRDLKRFKHNKRRRFQ